MAQLVSREITYAPEAFRMLRGCFCLYKPSKKGFAKTRLALVDKIVHELNSMEVRPPRERVEITGELTGGDQGGLQVQIKPNLADHPLVSGPRYTAPQIAMGFVNNPGWYSSGVMVGFIGSDTHKFRHYRRFPRIYEVKGQLGLASINYRDDGKVISKSTFKHVNRTLYERVLSKIESAQRSLMFKMSGVDLRSEEAYQMATQGLAIPLTKTMPVVYAIQATSCEPPNFSFRIQCYNENEIFLAQLVNEIGLEMRSNAFCTGIRLTNLGPFSVEHALLQKHWDLENLIENIYYSNRILQQYDSEQKTKQQP